MNKFAGDLIEWYNINKRDLPWRNTISPYFVWLSEIILQQTRVEQGMPYYNNFIVNYPSVEDLAKADLDDVLKLWQGLGYYSRARNLHKTANEVAVNLNGNFPESYKELLKLKGVGDYTASAIASFCYKEPVPVLDGNVYRFIARLFGVYTEINTPKAKKEFKEILFNLIDKDRPDLFNQAIMEFGALHCTPKNPSCDDCVFNSSCHAHVNNVVLELPVKAKSKKSVNRYFNYFVCVQNDQVILKKRKEKDIWLNLYEFPMLESEEVFIKEEYDGSAFIAVTKQYKHILSHQNIWAKFYLVNEMPEKFDRVDENIEINISELDKYPIHRLLDKFLTETNWLHLT